MFATNTMKSSTCLLQEAKLWAFYLKERWSKWAHPCFQFTAFKKFTNDELLGNILVENAAEEDDRVNYDCVRKIRSGFRLF